MTISLFHATSENTYLLRGQVHRRCGREHRKLMDEARGDFEELSELLFGVKERYRSVLGTIPTPSMGR